MALIVQKYGGTSVGSAERIKAVAARVIKRVDGGDRLVVVVSAMGQTTDELIALAREMTDEPEPRELDLLLSTGEIVSSTLLAMALKHSGHAAVALSGAQAGIRTDTRHGKARIAKLEAVSYEEMLELASYGAKVMHPRAVELGAVFNVPILVASRDRKSTRLNSSH